MRQRGRSACEAVWAARGGRPGLRRPTARPRPTRPPSSARTSRPRLEIYNRRMPTHGIFRAPPPRNEPVRDYAPGSPERGEVRVVLERMRTERTDVPLVIGGEDVRTGDTFQAVMPHDKDHVLA